MAAAASHNFIYDWALAAHNFTIIQAVNLFYISSVVVFCTGTVFGLIIWKTKQYSGARIMGGAITRIVVYGVMFRVRTTNPSRAVLFIVQLVQGLGSSIVQTGTLGSAIGTAISGAIYPHTFREELAKALGDDSTSELIDTLFNSITSTLIPAWGTVERSAINTAFVKVTSYFFIAAMAIIVPCFSIICDSQNLIEENGMLDGKITLMHNTTTAEGRRAENKKTKEIK
ncbi:hypothetical protein BKA65DRAFT_600485 [Rhexocercosporidium sp. MPI-PUGE-AT-0058]|nr:hypothetical protein BKA65DRAFT_600485 [Rhexocercosporidium sp. MPI-PUGE-AT-0058]